MAAALASERLGTGPCSNQRIRRVRVVTFDRETWQMDQDMPRLALTVERHGTGKYFWVLLESDGMLYEYRKLFESASTFLTYRAAFDAGLEALWKSAPELSAQHGALEQISSSCHQS